MTLNLLVCGQEMAIDDDLINHDIEQLEAEGKTGKMASGVYLAPRPDIHGLLCCFRDNRKYNPADIERVCYGVCPFFNADSKLADDSLHLDDCKKALFEGTGLDGSSRYVVIINH